MGGVDCVAIVLAVDVLLVILRARCFIAKVLNKILEF